MEKTKIQASSSSFMGKWTQSLMDNVMEIHVIKHYLKVLNKFHPSGVQKKLNLLKVKSERLLSLAKMANKLKIGLVKMVKNIHQQCKSTLNSFHHHVQAKKSNSQTAIKSLALQSNKMTKATYSGST